MFKRSWLGLLVMFLLLPVQAAVDPTRPPTIVQGDRSQADVPVSPLQLQSIRISEQIRRAQINGVSVSEGERVRGAEVVAIQPGSVVLKQGSRRIQLELGSTVNIKRNSQESQ